MKMTREQIRQALLEAIDTVAPGAVPDEVDEAADLREQMDLDSMDLLNLVADLHERLGVEIPDADVDRMTTLSGAIEYLARELS